MPHYHIRFGGQPRAARIRLRPALIAGIAMMVLAACTGGWTSETAVPSALAAHPITRLGGFSRVAGRPWLDQNKPVALFVAAQYCPFCATERWSLVLALSAFGHWSGLREMHSTVGEGGYPSIATYDLLHATYSSPTVALQEREVADF